MEAIQRNELRPALHLGVVAIEKGAFGSPSTLVANFTYLTKYHTYNKLKYLKKQFNSMKMDLELNNQQGLICHKPKQTKYNTVVYESQ